VFYSNFVPKMNRFENFDLEKYDDLEIGVKGHSVIGTDTYRSATYNFY